MPAMPPDDEARAMRPRKAIDPARFDEAALKRHEVGEAASVVSAIPGVRAALFNFQQEFAAAPPGAVLDGRDIGTVICPQRRGEDFRHGVARRCAPAAAPWSCAGAARTVDETTILSDIIAPRRARPLARRRAADAGAGRPPARYQRARYRRGVSRRRSPWSSGRGDRPVRRCFAADAAFRLWTASSPWHADFRRRLPGPGSRCSLPVGHPIRGPRAPTFDVRPLAVRGP